MRSAARLCLYSLFAVVLLQFTEQSKAFSANAKPQNIPSYQLLTDLDTLVLRVEVPSDFAGINKSFLDQFTEKIEDKLQKANLKIFKPREELLHKLTTSTDLAVNIELLKIETTKQLVFRIQTSLIRPVTTALPSRLTFKIEVWHSRPSMQIIPIESAESQITRTALDQIDELCSTVKVAKSITKQNSAPKPVLHKNQNTPKQPQQISNQAYVASKNSGIFHKSTCPSAKRNAVGNIVSYKTRQEAIEAGKRPCKRCNP